MFEMSYIEEVKEKIAPLLKRNDVEFAGIFGSYAREENRPDSDLDVLVRFSKPKSLFDLVGLEMELSDKLGRKVDVVTEKYLHPYLHPQVSKDLKVLYGQRQYI